MCESKLVDLSDYEPNVTCPVCKISEHVTREEVMFHLIVSHQWTKNRAYVWCDRVEV